jgi:hypothetical protein
MALELGERSEVHSGDSNSIACASSMACNLRCLVFDHWRTAGDGHRRTYQVDCRHSQHPNSYAARAASAGTRSLKARRQGPQLARPGDRRTPGLGVETRILQLTEPVPGALALNADSVQTVYADYQELSLGREGLDPHLRDDSHADRAAGPVHRHRAGFRSCPSFVGTAVDPCRRNPGRGGWRLHSQARRSIVVMNWAS